MGGHYLWDSSLKELALEQNIWEGEELALSERKKDKREEWPTRIWEMTLAKYMVCVWRGGSQHLAAPRVLSALAFLPCLCWAKKGAREVPHTSPGKLVQSRDKTCGSPVTGNNSNT